MLPLCQTGIPSGASSPAKSAAKTVTMKENHGSKTRLTELIWFANPQCLVQTALFVDA